MEHMELNENYMIMVSEEQPDNQALIQQVTVRMQEIRKHYIDKNVLKGDEKALGWQNLKLQAELEEPENGLTNDHNN